MFGLLRSYWLTNWGRSNGGKFVSRSVEIAHDYKSYAFLRRPVTAIIVLQSGLFWYAKS